MILQVCSCRCTLDQKGSRKQRAAPVHDALAVAVVQRLEQQEDVVADVVVAQHGVQHLEVLQGTQQQLLHSSQ
jgi:hypothetical protein